MSSRLRKLYDLCSGAEILAGMRFVVDYWCVRIVRKHCYICCFKRTGKTNKSMHIHFLRL